MASDVGALGPEAYLRQTEAVRRFSNLTILVFGDVMLDEYLWGEVHRVSPEAPVPVVEIKRETVVPGGAANAACGVVTLGGSAELGGVLGQDYPGQRLMSAVRDRGVAVSGLQVDLTRPTTIKTRVVAGSQHVVRADRELAAPLSEQLQQGLREWAKAKLPAADAVIVSDYAKGTVTADLSRWILAAAGERGVPAVVDPKGRQYDRYEGAIVVTPNRHEAELASGETIVDEAGLSRAAHRLMREFHGSVIITRGSAGMSVFEDVDQQALHIPTVTRNVYDVTGAGDTVVACLTLALASGLPLVDAAHVATLGAGIAVGRLGTAAVSAAELLEALKADVGPRAQRRGDPAGIEAI